jgi:membrane protein
LHFKQFYHLARQAVAAWIDDYAPSMGAAISGYTVFSIASLLIIVIAVAGSAWGREAVQGEIVAQLTGLIGQDGAIGVQALTESANKLAKGLIASIISVAVLIVGATTVFAELQSAPDRVRDVPPSQKASGIWANGLFPGWELMLQVVFTVISLGISSLLFAMIFKLMPQARLSWRDVWVGAAVPQAGAPLRRRSAAPPLVPRALVYGAVSGSLVLLSLLLKKSGATPRPPSRRH